MMTGEFSSAQIANIIYSLLNSAKNSCLVAEQHDFVKDWLQPLTALLPEYTSKVSECVHELDHIFEDAETTDRDTWMRETAQYRQFLTPESA